MRVSEMIDLTEMREIDAYAIQIVTDGEACIYMSTISLRRERCEDEIARIAGIAASEPMHWLHRSQVSIVQVMVTAPGTMAADE